MQRIRSYRLYLLKASSIFIPTLNVKGNPMTDLPCPKTISSRDAFNLQLERQGIYIFPDAAQVRLVCTGGAVWITLDGEAADVVLSRCDEFTTPLHTRAVVYALKPSGLFVAPLVGDARDRRSRPSFLRRIGNAMASGMPRYLDRYIAHSPNQAMAASSIWY
jgi:Protein of unknown function (DUF2917)